LHTSSRFFRLTATTAIVGLALGPLLPQPGFAQSGPPPLAPPAASPAPQPQTTADPPTRVGRLSRVVGQVSFHGIGADHWDAASLNFPVTSGDSFWTQPSASADLGVTNNRLTMDQSTELDVATLDDHSFVATIPQGQIYLRLAALQAGETYAVTTPRGTVSIAAPGRYEISAGDTQDPTRITVVEGSAQVSGTGGSDVQVAANQTLLITGDGPFQTQVTPAQRDAFLTAQLAREQPAVPTGAVAAPAEVVQMTGGEDLYEYGAWSQSQDYGSVWYPQAAAGYVPYRNGHWAYVAPWGWTWVDAAPWGFAPFHYGRWVQIGGRWGWAPGGGGVAYGAPGYIAPVYAPALVTFFGIAAGVAVGAALAGGFGGNVGWCPLGWQEPYRPWYRTSPAYVRNVNATYVRNVGNITTINNNNVTINNFANRGGATMVPASAMALSRPIGSVARPIPQAQYAQYHPVVGRDPITPTTATVGVTHGVAQEMHLAAPPPGAGAAARPAAPGPAIRGQAVAPNARPPLEANGRPAAAGSAATAVVPHAPGPPIEPHGTAGAPALRTPGTVAGPEARPTGTRAAGPVAGSETHPAGPEARPETRPAGPVAGSEARPVGPEARPETRPAGPVAGPVHTAQPQPQVREATHPGTPAVAPHPQVAQPQFHAPAQPHVAQQPQFRAPEQPHVVQAPSHAPPPVHNAERAAPAPHPAPQPHPQEKRQKESHDQGGGGREPHRG
jgi:uncharacterized protein YaiE (UPF0345 family)